MAFEPIANDGFCSAKSFFARRHSIHFCGVNEVDTQVDGAADDIVRHSLRHLLTKSHGAQADGGDV